jgi:hypothetical protein
MDERTGDQDERRDALLHLHALVKGSDAPDPGAVPGFGHPSAPAALRTVAEADERDVSVAARLQVLRDLAGTDATVDDKAWDEYRRLAGSVAQLRGIDADQLLSDLKESAHEGVPFERTPTGQALPHRDVAFIGQDVCTTREVMSDGLRAAWIFSEFETDATFDQVAGWVDPRSWPERGPMMFKRMDLVGSPTPIEIATLSTQHWHGVFHEEVQLVTRVNTLLHCDYWRGERACGMTYSLDLSLDSQLDVDRGFLSVEDLGKTRRVRALKIVGFTTKEWNDVAQMVCPFWTDWVRGAVEGGTTSGPVPTDTSSEPRQNPSADTLDAWIDFFSESAHTYLDLFTDIGNRVTAGGSTPADWLSHGSRYWSQLAKDWARAWTYGLEALEEVAREGLDAGLTPPGTDPSTGRGLASAMTAAATRAAATPAAATRAAATPAGAAPAAAAPGQPFGGEGTVVPLPGLAANTAVTCSPLVSLESGGATISDVSVTVEALEGGVFGARVQTTDSTAPAGLYAGTLETPGGKKLAPVQLYVARVREAGTA